MSDHARLFAFEADFVATLRCIPMVVRFKLDLAGVKLSLRQWSRLTEADRRDLVLTPGFTPSESAAYRARLVALLDTRCGEAARPLPPNEPVAWDKSGPAPASVSAFAMSLGAAPIPDDAWGRLTPLERFVLLKLSRDNHDNVNFIPAMKELGLYRSATSETAVA